MSELTKTIGQRIRNYRNKAGLSQEKLAELAGCHSTYIGQLERGEKNATIESVARIASALDIPLEALFEKIGKTKGNNDIPLKCYELLASKTQKEQEHLYRLLLEVDHYKDQ